MDDREKRQSTLQIVVDEEMSDEYLKAGFVISVAQKGLKGFMDYSKKRDFERTTLPMACGKSCNVCSKYNFTLHKEKCGNHRCLSRIQKESIHELLNNTKYLSKFDPRLRSKAQDIIAKCNMPYNQEKRIGGSYDISAFAKYFKNNKHARDYFVKPFDVPIVCQKILECRRVYAHSTFTMGMTKKTLDELISNLLILLPATKIKNYNEREVDECIQILEEVKRGEKTFSCIVKEPKDDRPEVKQREETSNCIVLELKDVRPEVKQRLETSNCIAMGPKDFRPEVKESEKKLNGIDMEPKDDRQEVKESEKKLNGIIMEPKVYRPEVKESEEKLNCIVMEPKVDRPKVKESKKKLNGIVMEPKDDRPEVKQREETSNCIFMEPKDVSLEVKQREETSNCIVIEPKDVSLEKTEIEYLRSLIGLDNEQENNDFDMKTRSLAGYDFRTTVDDTIKDTYVYQYADLLPSVGLLYSSVTKGTLFRVGTKYAMTDWHVVEKMIDPHGTEHYDFNKLYDRDIRITFGHAQFRLKGLDIFSDKYLDISVLEFTDDAPSLPPPLSLLRDEVFGANSPIKDLAIIGYGHPNNENKIVTHRARILRKDDAQKKIEKMMHIMSNSCSSLRQLITMAGNDPNSVERGYNGYACPDRILFDSYVGPGASGSPLFSKEDPSSLKVVAVYKSGYPEFEYHLPPQRTIGAEYTFEMATKMSSIYKSIASRDQNLMRDLFQ